MSLQRAMEHADHPGRSLIGRPGQPEPGRQGGVGSAADHCRGTRVWCRVSDGAEGDDEIRVETIDRLDDALHVRRPGDVGLDAFEGDEVAPLPANGAEDVLRPGDPVLPVEEFDRRPDDAEVVEPIRVDPADDHAVRVGGDQSQGRSRHAGGVEPPAEGDEQHGVGKRRSIVDRQDERLSHRRASAWWSTR